MQIFWWPPREMHIFEWAITRREFELQCVQWVGFVFQLKKLKKLRNSLEEHESIKLIMSNSKMTASANGPSNKG